MTARDSYYPVVLTLLVVDAIAVALRFWARSAKGAVGYDDMVMAGSYAGFVLLGAMELIAVRYGIGATVMEPDFDMIKAAMYFTIAQVVYILATCLSKIGVGLVLLRLADGSDMSKPRITLVVSMVIFSIWSLVSAMIFGLQCRPLSVAWGVGEGTCLSTVVLGNTAVALSVVDVTISWIYALLPVWMLHKAQLPIKLKVSILILLGMGAISSLATIIRLKFVVEVMKISATAGLASPDVVQKTLEATVYSIIEIGFSIFAAALTALRPLLRKIPCFADISSGAKSGSIQLHSIKTFGQRSIRAPDPRYRLEGHNGSLDDSQENIVPAKTAAIQKQVDIELIFESKADASGGSKENW